MRKVEKKINVFVILRLLNLILCSLQRYLTNFSYILDLIYI